MAWGGDEGLPGTQPSEPLIGKGLGREGRNNGKASQGSQLPRKGVKFPQFLSPSLTTPSDVTFSSLVRGVRASHQ